MQNKITNSILKQIISNWKNKEISSKLTGQKKKK
jgi:hypothetical protein